MQSLLATTASGLQRNGQLDAVLEKYGARVLPCGSIGETAVDMNRSSPPTADGYGPLQTPNMPRGNGRIILP